MKFIRGLYNLTSFPAACVATIGNFDGVHLGHQQLLQRLTAEAKLLNMPSLVIIFEPHPREYFSLSRAPGRLTNFREKLSLLEKLHVDYVLCLHFNIELATTSAAEFVQNILIKKLHVNYLIIGDDFRFGKNRAGDITLLRELGKQFQMAVHAIPAFTMTTNRISSTRIRQALAMGNLAEAEQLLGRPYSLCGRIAHGQKRGRTLGFPTANVYLKRKVVPLNGVFAVQVYGIQDSPVNGVANIGNRPTVDGTRIILEIHLLNFARDIYGLHISVNFLHKIRDELRFESLELLQQQIAADVAEAKQFFSEAHRF